MSLITLLIVLAVLALLFGGYNHTRGDAGYGPYWGWGPVGLILVIILVLFLVGAIHV